MKMVTGGSRMRTDGAAAGKARLSATGCAGRRAERRQSARLLWVEQVSIPDYLAGNGVVYQTTDAVCDRHNLWASPLDQQLRTTLVANLSQQLPGWGVVPAAGERAGYPQRCGQWLSWSL